MNSCLDEQQLYDLAAGEVAEDVATKWRAHIEACVECGRAFNEWEENLKLVGALHDNPVSVPALLPVGGPSLPDFISRSSTPDVSQSDAGPKPEAGELPQIQDYRIIRELHRGGQGVVYEAVQLSTRRTVALKLLDEGGGASRRSQQRFEREIELIASLKHSNIVTIHDSGITRGQYYYAMDYIRGEPLDTHVRMANLDVRSRVRLFKTVCDAMAYAHRQGVIHRDLKPSNILVDFQGNPFVLDFGLARILKDPDHATLTLPGVVLGTIPYMSPEQTAGMPGAIDTRTDVYTLGVILYDLLTGFAPYETPHNDVAKAFDNIRNIDPTRPSKWNKQVNTEVDAIVLKAMEKDPERRYGSAGEMTADITAFLEGRPVQAKSASSLYVLRKLVIKHSFESLVVLAMILGLGGFGAVALDQTWEAHKARNAEKDSRQFAAERSASASDAIQRAAPSGDGKTLGWFLLEWHQGRLDQARALQSSIHHPDYAAAMTFLLNGRMTLDELQRTLSPAFQPLAYFVAAERETKADRQENAIANYKRSLEVGGDPALRSFIEARLKQLRSNGGAPGPSSAPAQ